MHSVGGQRYCSRSLASASRGLPVLGRVQVCSQRRAQTSTLPTPAAPSAGLKQEQRQWSAAVESQLLKWGVEDQTTANDLLVALRAAGLNRPLNFAVATVLSDVIPQLLATAVLGAGAILSFKAIAWAFMDVSASLLLRFLGGLLGAASGLGFFWPESALGFVKVAGYLYSGIRYSLHTGAFLDAVKCMAARCPNPDDSNSHSSVSAPAPALS